MALCRCHEADGAVAMLMVVPVRQIGDSAPSCKHVFKRLDRQVAAVLERSERRFYVRSVIADSLPAAHVGHSEALHGGQHGFAFHGSAIVRVHRQLAGADALARADVAQQLAGDLGALAIEHLPANDLAAEQILEQA